MELIFFNKQKQRTEGKSASKEVQAGGQEAKPNHTDPKHFAVQQLTNKILRFQKKVVQ